MTLKFKQIMKSNKWPDSRTKRCKKKNEKRKDIQRMNPRGLTSNLQTDTKRKPRGRNQRNIIQDFPRVKGHQYTN